jgi:DNA repair photolyase
MDLERVSIGKVLTRTSGYLETVTSHSLQPYRGCPLGQSLCGVGCYVQHSRHLVRGRQWGSFLEVRENAADSYRRHVDAERRWAHRHRGRFSIFLSSATEPFPPQERRFGITRSVLEAMVESPPDLLVLQSHSHRLAEPLELLLRLAERTELRCHLSIETDRERLPGLPPHGSPVARRFEAAARLKAAGLCTVVTVSPLLPIAEPDAFFARIAEVADAVVLDHFIGGDGSATGSRTRRTPLPAAMEAIEPGSTELDYRHRMAAVAERHLPGRVGTGIDGFAGRFS